MGVDDALKKLKSSEIKLVKFSVMNNDMMKAANNSPEKIQYLINWGNDARIAIEVFMAMDATLATKFDNDASVTLLGRRRQGREGNGRRRRVVLRWNDGADD